MNVNLPKLGGGLLAAGTVLLNFASQKMAWWMGLTLVVVGPILLSLRTPSHSPKKKKKKISRR